nr:hypothetical protein CFP56_29596 [Quercus suber]
MLILYHQRNNCNKNSHWSCKILNSSSFIIHMKMKYQKAQEILSKRIQHRTTEQRFGKRLISCQKCHRPGNNIILP